ncbi:MAG: 3-oxoacyl-ACP synthase III [Planctomycetota bacterium]
MRLTDVVLAGIGVTIPPHRCSSDQLECRLDPLYRRLKLPAGRLELMSGIASRRLWNDPQKDSDAAKVVPSGPSIESGRAALRAAEIDPETIGCLIHASVCRDFLEPATASRVHHELRLPAKCWVYDVSNACLGVLNGATQIANLIQAGAIEAGIVVGTENSGPLMEATIAALNDDKSLTRRSVKPAFASLTIGSGSCAWLLTHRRLRPDATSIDVAIANANTKYHDLCLSDQDTAGAGMQPLMETDSEALMAQGIATGVAALDDLLVESTWSRESIERTVCHQVGVRHQIAMLEAMGLTLENDCTTYSALGNTGSVALPLTVAAAIQSNRLMADHRTALLGIGSGINSVMMAARWGQTPVEGQWHGLLEELAAAAGDVTRQTDSAVSVY